MPDYNFDFLFIGGGILGSSGAMALSKGLESPANPLWDSLCTRQGSNLQPCDPKSLSVSDLI